MKKKFLGLDILQWIIIFSLILLEKLQLITFANSIIILIVLTGLELILQELMEIRKYLENIQKSPYHFNCRHSITPYFEDEEAKK